MFKNGGCELMNYNVLYIGIYIHYSTYNLVNNLTFSSTIFKHYN